MKFGGFVVLTDSSKISTVYVKIDVAPTKISTVHPKFGEKNKIGLADFFSTRQIFKHRTRSALYSTKQWVIHSHASLEHFTVVGCLDKTMHVFGCRDKFSATPVKRKPPSLYFLLCRKLDSTKHADFSLTNAH
jgi:hypothetical protein